MHDLHMPCVFPHDTSDAHHAHQACAQRRTILWHVLRERQLDRTKKHSNAEPVVSNCHTKVLADCARYPHFQQLHIEANGSCARLLRTLVRSSHEFANVACVPIRCSQVLSCARKIRIPSREGSARARRGARLERHPTSLPGQPTSDPKAQLRPTETQQVHASS